MALLFLTAFAISLSILLPSKTRLRLSRIEHSFKVRASQMCCRSRYPLGLENRYRRILLFRNCSTWICISSLMLPAFCLHCSRRCTDIFSEMISLLLLFLSASGGEALDAGKLPVTQQFVSISSQIIKQEMITTARIPHGQLLQIICPQNNDSTAITPSRPPSPDQSPVEGSRLQTVHVTEAWYIVRPSDFLATAQPGKPMLPCVNAEATTAVQKICNSMVSTNCTIQANDISKATGCQQRRLMLKYSCAAPSPMKNRKMMVNNMIDD